MLFVLPRLAVGGAEIGLLELMRALDRERFELAICSLEAAGPLTSAFRALGVPVWCLGVAPGIAELRGAGILGVLREYRPHVVHARLILASLWSRLGRVVGARVITDEQGVAHERPRLVTSANRITQRLCDLTIANSSAVAAVIRARDGVGTERLRVVHTGIDVSAYRPRSVADETEHDLIAIARLERYKGVLDLVRTMERVVAARPGTTLAIIGDGSLRRELEAAIGAKGLGGQVRLLGARTDVPSLLFRSRALISASHEEGLSVAMLEAMAAGLPVVATNVGGSGEVVITGRTGVLVGKGDTAALADAALQYLADPALAAEHGAAGCARVREHFRVERMASEIEEIYRSLLAGGRGNA